VSATLFSDGFAHFLLHFGDRRRSRFDGFLELRFGQSYDGGDRRLSGFFWTATAMMHDPYFD